MTAPTVASRLAAALAAAHGPALRAYFRKAVGRTDVAEDLEQEVLLRVVRFADGFDERGRDRAWLFTIAHRVLTDHLRQASRPAPAGSVQAAQPADLVAVVPPTQEVRLMLQRALQMLEPLDRHAFLLAEVAGLTYAEIAIVLDRSHAAVRSRIYRARLALRDALAARPARTP